jgi:hypothetical protein
MDVASNEGNRVVRTLDTWTETLEVPPAPSLPCPRPRAVPEHHADRPTGHREAASSHITG